MAKRSVALRLDDMIETAGRVREDLPELNGYAALSRRCLADREGGLRAVKDGRRYSVSRLTLPR
jgi:hypothetical protein